MVKYYTDNKHKVICIFTIKESDATKLDIRRTYKGEALCSSEDTFDLEKGKIIAYKRALRNFYKTLAEAVGFPEDISYSLNYLAVRKLELKRSLDKALFVRRRIKELTNEINDIK